MFERIDVPAGKGRRSSPDRVNLVLRDGFEEARLPVVVPEGKQNHPGYDSPALREAHASCDPADTGGNFPDRHPADLGCRWSRLRFRMTW